MARTGTIIPVIIMVDPPCAFSVNHDRALRQGTVPSRPEAESCSISEARATDSLADRTRPPRVSCSRVPGGGSPMHFHQWKRREVMTLLGGAAAAWPLAARAQQRERMRRTGVLIGSASVGADDIDGRARADAFVQALQQLGWNEGRNVSIDYRWGTGGAEDIRKKAAEVVALEPDVLVTSGAASVAPLLQA